MDKVIEVGKALDIDVRADMIDVCHRLKKQNNRATPGIIVRFVRRTDKENMLQKRRVKRTLSTRHLGLPSDQPIYLNQSLSQSRRILFAKARQVKIDKKYKFLWVDKAGNIKIRRDEGSRPILISSADDLRKL